MKVLFHLQRTLSLYHNHEWFVQNPLRTKHYWIVSTVTGVNPLRDITSITRLPQRVIMRLPKKNEKSHCFGSAGGGNHEHLFRLFFMVEAAGCHPPSPFSSWLIRSASRLVFFFLSTLLFNTSWWIECSLHGSITLFSFFAGTRHTSFSYITKLSSAAVLPTCKCTNWKRFSIFFL